jgi:hypothetical protein
MPRSSRLAEFVLALGLSTLLLSGTAQAAYWNLFNFELEDQEGAAVVTYDTLEDMLLDQNRVSSFVYGDPFSGPNLIDSGSDGTTYWNLFNFELEDEEGAAVVTYATLEDMLLDQNRTGSFVYDDPFSGPNLVGTGSDGDTYWNLFNFELEDEEGAAIVTYDTLEDMLLDQNRTGSFVYNDPFSGPNLVDSDSDGTTYWNLFNFELEDEEGAARVTYATLMDMLLDQNRVASFVYDDPFSGPNLIGGGSDSFPRLEPIPEPSMWAVMILGFGVAGAALRRRIAYRFRSAPLPA